MTDVSQERLGEVEAIRRRIEESRGDDEEVRRLEAMILPEPDTSPSPEDPPQPTDQEPEPDYDAEPRAPAPAERVLRRARTQLGTREGPDNDSKYGDWYGLPNQFWCAMFVSWLFFHEGIPLRATTSRGFADCDAGASWFKSLDRWRNKTETPAPGDVVFFDLSATSPGLDHVGIVERLNADGSVGTIEGNTSDPTGASSHDGVFRKNRRAGIMGYGVPKFGAGTGGDIPARLPELKLGKQGPNVRRMRGLLRAAYSDLSDADFPVRGQFDASADDLVRRFQRERGLEQDGEVGENTWGALLMLPGELPPLKREAKGAPVRRLQGLLRAEFPRKTDADLTLGGNFGPRTDELLRKFQAQHDLAPKGEVRPRTWRVLLGLPET